MTRPHRIDPRRLPSLASAGFAVPAVLIGVSLVAGGVAALQPGRDAPETPRQAGDLEALAARAADAGDERAAIKQTIAEVYAVISGDPGPRDWDAFRGMFAAGGRLAAMAQTQDGGRRLVQMTPDEYIAQSGPMLEQRGFHEIEIAREIEIYGSIAHVFSSYEARWTAEGDVFMRGINSFSLIKMPDGGWKVYQILWQAESPDNPLPPQFAERER